MIYSRIVGTGSYLPPRVMTNLEFAARLDTSDAWIMERVGIRTRRTVLASGRILFTRWNHIAGKDQMDLYTINPDGTDLELYYGAQSHMTGTNGSVIEFSHPREMQSGNILVLARQCRLKGGQHAKHLPFLQGQAGQRLNLRQPAVFARVTGVIAGKVSGEQFHRLGRWTGNPSPAKSRTCTVTEPA